MRWIRLAELNDVVDLGQVEFMRFWGSTSTLLYVAQGTDRLDALELPAQDERTLADGVQDGHFVFDRGGDALFFRSLVEGRSELIRLGWDSPAASITPGLGSDFIKIRQDARWLSLQVKDSNSTYLQNIQTGERRQIPGLGWSIFFWFVTNSEHAVYLPVGVTVGGDSLRRQAFGVVRLDDLTSRPLLPLPTEYTVSWSESIPGLLSWGALAENRDDRLLVFHDLNNNSVQRFQTPKNWEVILSPRWIDEDRVVLHLQDLNRGRQEVWIADRDGNFREVAFEGSSRTWLMPLERDKSLGIASFLTSHGVSMLYAVDLDSDERWLVAEEMESYCMNRGETAMLVYTSSDHGLSGGDIYHYDLTRKERRWIRRVPQESYQFFLPLCAGSDSIEQYVYQFFDKALGAKSQWLAETPMFADSFDAR